MSVLDHGPAILFCPADRPERFGKALQRADAVILDLEDAVAPAAKVAARGALIESELDPDRVIVRVNPPGTDGFVADLATLSQTDYRTVMVAKAETPKQLQATSTAGSRSSRCARRRAVWRTPRSSPRTVRSSRLMWGAEDLVASLGGTSSRKPNGRYRDVARYARARVLLAAGAQGKAAIDAVHLDIAETKRLSIEAADAAASGFSATACIHPSQVEIIRAAYRPDESDARLGARVSWTPRARRAACSRFEGRMIDEPVLRHARAVLARSQSLPD